MGIPDDVVLDGYTLIEQHAIDHEFLTRQRFVPALLDGSLIVLHRFKNRKCSA